MISCFLFFLHLFFFFSFFFFFFSSRRRHTRLTCDSSSDVCSSDLSARFDSCAPTRQRRLGIVQRERRRERPDLLGRIRVTEHDLEPASVLGEARSEERRVGKECRWRWGRGCGKKKKDKREEVTRAG